MKERPDTWGKALKELWAEERDKIKKNPLLWIGLIAALLYGLTAALRR